MEKRKISWTLDIQPAACIVLAVAVVFIPLQWVICWLTAAAVHELCHLAMILLTGGDIYRVRIGVEGAVMQTRLRSAGAEILCAAAGPVGGLLLLLLARWAPRLALCGVVQSLCNLIPVYPLDGGRVIGGLMHRWFAQYAERIIKWITAFTLVSICAACICGVLFLDLGLLPVVFAGSILLRTGKIKIPCKDALLGVQ